MLVCCRLEEVLERLVVLAALWGFVASQHLGWCRSLKS